MTRHPRDRFDDVADGPRVGAHRGLPRRGRGWIVFAWAALATGVLVGGGALGLGLLNDSFQFTGGANPSTSASASASASPSATQEATADPSSQPADLTLTVLNGTATTGLAATGTATLESAGWQVASDGNASTKGATGTIVYYQSADQAAVARGVVKTLGVGSVQQSAAFPNADVTVVLGADYAR
ncbi:LytR C-terminal domain-containing protein [Curtobacterium sp. Leaf261]|uniref:LytR C-terminal domain-containing protein n=1 Tax=Curtobacterium sp. Leaf261 TaxID=1736311 RepID=UPI0006FDC17D|nr:LytR C-terminal domain-containing protein [Curtobacterium sp. Leaf261]KQO63469.1 hypothetical protein ASF23_04230 [Curtobacterium sp. Leaf261]